MELGFLEDIKGDMCRLGYLKILPFLMGDFESIEPERLALLLEENTTKSGKPKWTDTDFPNGLSTTGLVPTAGKAINYVELATKLEFFNKERGIWAKYGIICNKLFSIDLSTTSINPLILDEMEKIFFLKILLEKDGMVITKLMDYFITKKEFSRKEAMNFFMENIYLDILRGLQTKDIKFQEKYDSVLEFKKNRELLEKDKEWANSEQYADYRHRAVPRIEWLVDIGFLDKKMNSGYKITNEATSINKVVNDFLSNEESDLYSLMVLPLKSNQQPISQSELISKIISSNEKFIEKGHIVLLIDDLVEFVTLKCISEKKYVTKNSIKNTINEMIKKYPKYVKSLLDLYGKPTKVSISREFIQ